MKLRSAASAVSQNTFLTNILGSYRDPASTTRFIVATPTSQPELWLSYLDGAVLSYRKHGVENVLEYRDVVDGRSTAAFFAAVELDGSVSAGMRIQGRYSNAGQAHALQEWAGRPGTVEVHQEITQRIPEGVIEMKTGWVNDEVAHRADLTNALARIFVHSLSLMNVRWAMGTVATHAVNRWRTTGGVVSTDVTPVAYPDERYRTTLMWWDRQSFADLALPEQLPFIMAESAELTNSELPARTRTLRQAA